MLSSLFEYWSNLYAFMHFMLALLVGVGLTLVLSLFQFLFCL